MNTGTLIDIVAIINARIDKLNKGKQAVDASSYSVLNKRLSFERIAGATNELQRLSDYLQVAIDAEVASIEQ